MSHHGQVPGDDKRGLPSPSKGKEPVKRARTDGSNVVSAMDAADATKATSAAGGTTSNASSSTSQFRRPPSFVLPKRSLSAHGMSSHVTRPTQSRSMAPPPLLSRSHSFMSKLKAAPSPFLDDDIEEMDTDEVISHTIEPDVDALPDEEYQRVREASVQSLQSQIDSMQDPCLQSHQSTLNQIYLDTMDDSQKADQTTYVVPVPTIGVDDTLNKYTVTLVEGYKDSIRGLVRAALDLRGMPCDRWVTQRMNVSKESFAALESEFVVMLASIDPDILKHIVEGDLPAAEARDPQLKQKLNNLKQRRPTDLFPSIYIQYLVDDRGRSPTPAILYKFLESMELYLKGFDTPGETASHKFANKIDNLKGASSVFRLSVSEKGIRKYCAKTEHLNTLNAFIASTRARLGSNPPDIPLKRPLCEVGWAKKLMQRLNAHASHNSSNYIMNLMEAIAILNFKAFSIQQYGIFHIFNQVHAMLGEIICSRMAQAYISHGGGFSHCAAGISHRGANEMLENDYRELQLKIYSDADFQSRLLAETDNKTIGRNIEIQTDTIQLMNIFDAIRKLTIDLPKKFDEMVAAEAAEMELESRYVQKASIVAAMLRRFRAAKQAAEDNGGSSTQ